VPRLVHGYEVVCTVRDATRVKSEPALAALGVDWVQADLADAGFARALPGRADAVVHLAVAPPSLAPEPAYAFHVNAAASLALLEWAKRAGIKRFLFTSSGSVYGPQAEPIVEETRLRPGDLLGVAKAAAEMLAALYSNYFAVVILRIWRPYGPGQPANFLIPRLAARIRAGEPIQLCRGGHPRENTIYIDDLLDVTERALRLERTVTMNVAHAHAPGIDELCRELEKAIGRPARFEHVNREAGDRIADVARLEDVLGFRAQVTPGEGLRQVFGVH
jgi:nucleoside-diphosphate-sugar epimerase